MPKYIVGIREIWVQSVEIEADNKEEAVMKIREGNGDYLDNELEYSDTMDEIEWTVEEVS